MRTLKDLREGESATIVKVNGNGAFRKRILEMGFIRGKTVTVIKAAPLQDPVEYRIMNSNVSLRLAEAGLVEVCPANGKPLNNNKDILDNPVLNGSDYKAKTSTEKKIRVAIVGNPNSGKTTIFNYATRSREHTGNFAGVTVDSKKALIKTDGYILEITDLPGTYSITHYSPEELFVRHHLTNELPDVVINVLDATNLERNLYLTTQLIDMNVKVVIALNMYDELILKGDHFNYATLGKMIGIPIVPTVGSKGKGIKELFNKVIEVYEDRDPAVRMVDINHGKELEESIERIKSLICENKEISQTLSSRYYAIKLLEKDRSSLYALSGLTNYSRILAAREEEIKRLENLFTEDTETLITNAKYGFVEGALKETLKPSRVEKKSLSKKIDTILTGKVLSYPFFLFAMWLMFQATFTLGEYPVLLLENMIDRTATQVNVLLPDGIFKDLVVDGILGGVGGVLVFLPNILILFFFISLMEDTGYMSRVAFILDKLMHNVGLHGKSFIPLLMGFGCNVPAIMATRTIESRNDRLVTMLIIPFMSCSARYPVYILIISTFFTKHQGSVLFLIYLAGIFLAGLFAFLFKKTLYNKKEIPFVMELPPYRMPTAKAILKHTWFKGSLYLKKMGGIILIASIIIWALGYFPKNEAIVNKYEKQKALTEASFAESMPDNVPEENVSAQEIRELLSDSIRKIDHAMQRELQQSSFIGKAGRFIEPVLRPLGFDWKMGVSLIAGLAAKEIVVSTMGVLYQSGSDNGNISTLSNRIKEEKYQAGSMAGKPVYSPLAALSFIVFVLIYFPCVAVLAAVRRESGGWKHAIFLAVYTTASAWIFSFLVFNVGRLLGF